MKECITHHHACDCREETFKKLEIENAELKAENNYLNRMLADERSGDCDKDKAIKRLTSNLEICDNELAASESRIEKLREALEFYADKNNWYDANAKYTEKAEMPILYMIIASIDTEGETWLGGRTAREALKKLRGE